LASEVAKDRDYSVAVVQHTLRVLETFLEEGGEEQSAKEISDRLGLNRSRVFRLLSTLESQGYVRQDRSTKRYRLGLKLFELGQVVVKQFDLVHVAEPILDGLTEHTGETSYIYLLDGLEAVTVAKRECTQPMRIHAQIGQRDTLESGAACNLLLAHLPLESIDRVLRDHPLPQRTSRTVTDRADLKKKLAEIRELGYHLSREEDQEGVDAIAAPIRDRNGQVVAALAIAGPSLRFTPEKTRSFVRLVCETAAQISTEIGYLPNGS
jgi:DNA-binding IclR family transcriptional regulator